MRAIIVVLALLAVTHARTHRLLPELRPLPSPEGTPEWGPDPILPPGLRPLPEEQYPDVDPLPGLPPRLPPGVVEPEVPIDVPNVDIPSLESGTSYFPNAENPLVIVHVEMVDDEESYPVQTYPLPETDYPGVPYKQRISIENLPSNTPQLRPLPSKPRPDLRPLPGPEGPSVQPNPDLPIIEFEPEAQQPIVELFVKVRKQQKTIVEDPGFMPYNH